jgi:hypothetical protein
MGRFIYDIAYLFSILIIRHILQIEIRVSNFELTFFNFELDESSFCNSKFELVSCFFFWVLFYRISHLLVFFFHPVHFFRTLSLMYHHTFRFLTCTVSFDFLSLYCFSFIPPHLNIVIVLFIGYVLTKKNYSSNCQRFWMKKLIAIIYFSLFLWFSCLKLDKKALFEMNKIYQLKK